MLFTRADWLVQKWLPSAIHLQTYIHTYIHTYSNIKYQVTKKKEKKLSTDKNVDYKNSLHFDNKIASYDL